MTWVTGLTCQQLSWIVNQGVIKHFLDLVYKYWVSSWFDKAINWMSLSHRIGYPVILGATEHITRMYLDGVRGEEVDRL